MLPGLGHPLLEFAHLALLENAKLISQTSTNGGHLQQEALSSQKEMSLLHIAGQSNGHMYSSSKAAAVWKATRQPYIMSSVSSQRRPIKTSSR